MVATTKNEFTIKNTYSELDDSHVLNDQVIVNRRPWSHWRDQAMKRDFKGSYNWQILSQDEKELMNRLITAQD